MQPSGDLCIVATGVVQGMGSGTLFVRCCGRAGRGDIDMGHQQTRPRNQTHLDIKTHLSCYGSAEAERALSIQSLRGRVGWYRGMTSWAQCVCSLWRSWLHTTLAVRTMLMMMMMMLAGRWACK